MPLLPYGQFFSVGYLYLDMRREIPRTLTFPFPLPAIRIFFLLLKVMSPAVLSLVALHETLGAVFIGSYPHLSLFNTN